MEPEGSLPCSQEPIGPELDAPSSQVSTLIS
jgi:hypothetical protein